MAHAETTTLDGIGKSDRDTPAWFWFFGALIVGAIATWQLSQIDFRMYSSGGEYINIETLRENRIASTAIRSEFVDERMHGGLENVDSALGSK